MTSPVSSNVQYLVSPRGTLLYRDTGEPGSLENIEGCFSDKKNYYSETSGYCLTANMADTNA